MSGGLEPMGAREHHIMVIGAASLLVTLNTDPDADLAEARLLEVGYARRKAELYERFLGAEEQDPDRPATTSKSWRHCTQPQSSGSPSWNATTTPGSNDDPSTGRPSGAGRPAGGGRRPRPRLRRWPSTVVDAELLRAARDLLPTPSTR